VTLPHGDNVFEMVSHSCHVITKYMYYQLFAVHLISATTITLSCVLSQYELWKRYTEFQQLCKQMDECHRQARSPDQLPRLLKAGFLDRFKESVIEERRVSVVEVLRAASTHPHLSPLLTAFVEVLYTLLCHVLIM